jgi:hypothetical protein
MNNTQVLNAIKSNDPAKVTSLANKFIGTFWISVNLLNGGKTKDFITQSILDRKHFFILTLISIEEKASIYLIMFQLALWSCVSNKCFRYITAALLNSRVDIKVDEEILWSWMENLVKCVTLTSMFVYHLYATDHQKQYPCCKVLLFAKSFLKIFSFL